ncbi:PAS domain S-box protein [Desulfonatronum sp. SC1]|uniref:PAS domain S-box protein n=1 Tax=Desulfonatronum sp. SC1 TaxID=2109626 RepID=UPI000D305E67|nr:PAS domain S-box protein [Desulfonatronum sp. SC1]PTN37316.1 hypothetical protein C6366_06640 [Desulfonatronum sp. SC1]
MLRAIIKTTFPALLSVLLIGVVLFALLLPKLQTALMDQKISMVRSMAQSAWSILDALHARVDKGELTLEEAQDTAKRIVHSMRYDDEGRNYFWILDYGHVTLVHPYQPGHVGRDISNLKDIRGRRFVAEMVQAAREHGEGLVTYYWEVMDESHNIDLKYAYAKDFQPWGWVLGTGVYMIDVRQEIGRITRDATYAGVGILLLVTAVALYFSWRGHLAERYRLQAADALRKSEEQYRALTENFLDTIMRFDRDFRLTYVNKMAAVQTGIPVEDWIGKTHQELGFPKELNRLWEETLARVFETGEVQRIEFMLPNGVWIDWLCVPELNANGQVQGVVTTARDITERRQAEEALKHSEATYRAVFNAVNDALYIHDLDTGEILDVNSVVLEKFGYSREEMQRVRVGDISSGIPPYIQEQADELVRKAIAGEPQLFEWHCRHRDGHLFWMETSLKRVVLAGQERLLAVQRDVSSQKQAEEALQLTQFAMDRAQDSIVWVDDRGALIYVNDAACSSMGYSRDELLRMSVFEIDPDFPVENWEEHKETMRRVGAMRFESRHRAKDGRIFPVEVTTNYLEHKGRFLAIAFDRDISERKRAEEELKQANIVVENSPAILFRWKEAPDWPVIMVSRNVSQFGYSRDELMSGKVRYAALVHPEDQERLSRELEDYAFRKVDRFQQEYRIVARDGGVRWVEDRTFMIQDEGGQVVEYQGIVLDVTERKRMEVELVASRRMLHEVINTIPVRVYWKGLDHCYLGCNRLFAGDAGHAEPESLVGKDDFALRWVGHGEAHRKGDRRVLEHGETVLNIERRHVFGDREVWLRMSKVPLLDDAGRIYGMLGTYDDITESKKMQEMMVETEKMMSVGGIAAGIAHEINNPLGIVLQAVQNLEQRSRADFRKNQEAAATIGLDLGLLAEYMRVRKLDVFMADIQSATLRAAAIIRHMLDFTRRSESRRDVCDLADTVQKALTLAQSDYDLKKSYDFKRIQVNQDISTDLPRIICTATEIEQVVLNLLRNAAQAMAESVPPVETPRIAIRVSGLSDGVRIEVEDNGPGIPPGIQARIFEPFFTTKPPGQGTGLGLSVSYFIVTKGHKGRMWVESSPGEGARFVVELPSSPANEARS